MRDGVTKKQGNSRRIVAASSGFPASFDDFRSQMIESGLLVDFSINEPGWQVLGTQLSAENLLSDATASKLGLGDVSTVNDAITALATNSEKILRAYSYEDAVETLNEFEESLIIYPGGIMYQGGECFFRSPPTTGTNNMSSDATPGSVHFKYVEV